MIGEIINRYNETVSNMSHSHSHSHNGHAHSHGHSNGGSSWASSNWGQSHYQPDNPEAGIMFQEEQVPNHAVEQLKMMVAQLKKAGEVPPDANETEVMMQIHQSMMKEREAYMKSLPHPGSQGQPVHTNQLSPPITKPNQEGSYESIDLLKLVKEFSALGQSHDGHCDHGSHDGVSMYSQEILSYTLRAVKQNPSVIQDQDENGDTVLHLLSAIGQQKPVVILLANTANPNTPNSSGQTPLHYAAKAGQIMVMQSLLEYGANITHRDSRGWTALHHAAAGAGEFCPHTLHYLTFCCGMSYADPTAEGQSPLHIVSSINKENNRAMINMLLEQPEINVNQTDIYGNTALHYATQECQPYVCYQLVNQTSAKSLLTANKEGKTPIDISKSLRTLEGFYLSEEFSKWMEQGSTYRPNQSKPYEYKKLLYMPSAFFLTLSLIAYYCTPSNQGWLTLLGFLSMQFMVFFRPQAIDHPSRLQNPASLGCSITLLCILGYHLVLNCVMTLYSVRPYLSLIVLITYPVSCALFYKLVTSDPGYNKESKRKESGVFYTMEDLVTTFKKPGIWCAYCRLIPTKPSKHCKVCDRCIYWMDHHCNFTMCCIGNNTYFSYIWFNIAIVITLQESIFDAIAMFFNNEGFAFCIAMASVQFLYLTLPLLIRNINNIGHGYTAFFYPRGEMPDCQLSYLDMLANVFTYLRSGRYKIKDPAFQF